MFSQREVLLVLRFFNIRGRGPSQCTLGECQRARGGQVSKPSRLDKEQYTMLDKVNFLGGRRVLLMLAGVVALASSQQACNAAGSQQINVRVGIYQNPPKIYLDHQGRPAGLFITLIKAIANDEHWHLNFVRCEWQACLDKLAHGQIDLMPDVAYSTKRKRLFDFHQVPVVHSWSVILIPAKMQVFSLGDLNHRRIALLAGAVQHGPLATLMRANDLQYTPLSYPTYAAAFAAVRDGKADAVVSNSFFADLYAHKYGLRETPIVFNPAALYFATTKGDPLGLLPPIDAHLRAWRYDDQSVYYKALKEAMVPVQDTVVPPMLHRLLMSAAVLLLLVLAMSVVLRWQVRRKTTQLHKLADRLDHMLHSSPVVLYQLVKDNGQLATRWVSDNLERLFGFTPDEFVKGNLWSAQLHPADRKIVEDNLLALSKKGHMVQEYRIIDSHGNTRYVRDEMRLLQTLPGRCEEIVGCWNDLTESRAQAARLSFLTHYDPLTRLPNRALLIEQLSQAIYQARREHRTLALLYVDIDRFKHINESLGLAVGDRVLKLVAERLSRLLSASDILARVGGNGFVVLMQGRANKAGAVELAKRITQSFIEPLHLQKQELALTLSVGISLYPADAEEAVILLQNAEAAMYEAKNAGRNQHRLYVSSHSQGLEDRLILETALRGAVAHSELLLHYQPQIDLNTRSIIGVEALVRWQHPQLGLVSPGRFIPVAEEMGVIGEIGAWVLERACRQMAAWSSSGVRVPRIAVNLSTQQIDDESLVPLVSDIIARTGIDPRCLELEVTESLIMREPAKATLALESFRKMGIQLAIDDFGTGYSSLNYLKHLPINRLKIDQSFVCDIGTDRNSEVICRAIIGLARSLELETVAEGIETQQQMAFLQKEGCTTGQGYLISYPFPAEKLPEFEAQPVQL